MPDDKNITHPLDAKRIDINDQNEVNNWCKSFDCSKDELKSAVNAVGTSATSVKNYLGK